MNAFAGYGAASANMAITLSKGELTPITMLWINRENVGGIDLSVQDVSTGTTVTNTSGWFVHPKECDNFVYNNNLPNGLFNTVSNSGTAYTTETIRSCTATTTR